MSATTPSLAATRDHGSLRAATLPLADVDAKLEEQWLELIRTTSADLSMAPQWFASTVRSNGAESSANVFALFSDEELVAAVPFVSRTEKALGVAARSREMPGNLLVAYHPGIVASIDFAAVLERFVVASAGACDLIVLPNVEKDGPTAQAARSVASRLKLGTVQRAGHASPYLTIESDWERFLSGKPKKFRYKVRTGLKDLEAAGAVVNRWFEGREDLDELVADILRIEANSWKAGAGMAISGSEIERRYYELLLPFLGSQRALHANVLYLDATPIAYSLCYVSNGGVRQLKTSFDNRHQELSPGSVTHRLSIQKAFESGAREFDFLGDEMPHKHQWASGVREHESIYLYLNSWRGVVVRGIRSFAARVRAFGV